MNERGTTILAVMRERRTVRRYRNDPVPKEDIDEILGAGASAPTAGNRQPWRFLVIDDPRLISSMREHAHAHLLGLMKKYGGKENYESEEEEELKARAAMRVAGFFSAPVFIIVYTDESIEYSHYNAQDGALAAGYICLAATALGYGSAYLTETISGEFMAKIVKVPSGYKFLCGIPIGIAMEVPPAPEKEKEEAIIFRNSFPAG